ncbi:MAG: hypothetical protein SFU99_08630 [Saprospiraceae bacterium]|nr:hypothetical protein [Saprospiraceae bacterium]
MRRLCWAVFIVIIYWNYVPGQVSLTSIGSAYTQDFNTFDLGTTADLPGNWAASGDLDYTPGGVYSNTGSYSNLNSAYALRDGSTSDYAWGAKVSASSGIETITLTVENNTGLTITSFDISWIGEQYSRDERATILRFSYSINGGSFTDLSAQDVIATTDAGSAINLNPINSTSRSITISGISLTNGQQAQFRFSILNGVGSDSNGHLGVDDFSLTPYCLTASIPSGGSIDCSSATGSLNIGSPTVTPTPTSPTYQWQRSTDGGTNWDNITSSTQDQTIYFITYSNYTGSSLSITQTSQFSDANGLRYRVIVTDGTCSGTSNSFLLSVTGCTTPIELIYFQGKITKNNILLNWQTATELDNDYIEVQRSKDGKRFETIGTVEGFGTTNMPRNYTFLDENPLPGVNYYRLKQVDFDGMFEYHPIIAVLFKEEKTQDLLVYPTIVHDRINLVLNEETDTSSEFMILDQIGRILLRTPLPPGLQQHTIDLQHLPAGQYFISVRTGRITSYGKFVK